MKGQTTWGLLRHGENLGFHERAWGREETGQT